MLAVVVLAGLLPNTGVVSASSNCTYGKCPASTSFPLWAVSAAAVIVVIALILALLLLRRSRRRPPSATSAAPGEGGVAGDMGAGEDGTPPAHGWDESSSSTYPEGETNPPESPGESGDGA